MSPDRPVPYPNPSRQTQEGFAIPADPSFRLVPDERDPLLSLHPQGTASQCQSCVEVVRVHNLIAQRPQNAPEASRVLDESKTTGLTALSSCPGGSGAG